MHHAEAKQKIQQLIDKYEAALKAGRIKSHTEEETKKDYILPLFESLGWDVYDRNEVTAEEQISGDRVDYGFYLNGRIKFYLEAKPFRADIHKEEYAQQAIRYSWNKGVTWAVLTDFENLIVFNALSPEKSLHGKRYFEIPYTEYLSRFEQLWQLSKESFTHDLIDAEAQKVGKKIQKILVSDQLYKDLTECRRQLTKAFSICNRAKNLGQHLIDEGVQRLLDRLIFIRVAEDRKIEPLTLRPLVNEWKAGGHKGSPFAAMIKKFRELDKIYNSNLFAAHPFETWEEYDGSTERVVGVLYGKNGYVEYDFSIIPADVLGAVYENYLGYKLQQSETRTTLFGSELELSKDSRKRKEQGIYYTPGFIVDYIVKNALGPVLDRCQSVGDLQKIKVLDPACGSGSFLIRAMQLIVKKYQEFGMREVTVFTKMQILTQNIYGVDLDEQAVEITRLNLLLNTFDAQIKLPDLGDNIKNGNSLISGTDEELKEYFGKNYRDKKPFSWQEEFPEVFKPGGFDCIIGNPPWGADIDEDSKFLGVKYPNSTKAYKDIYKIFIDKAIQLLKPGGSLGFITPNTFLYQPRYEDIKKVVDEYENYAVNLGEHIFGHVQLPSCILILQKAKGTNLFVADLTHKDRASLPADLSAVTKETGKAGAQATSGIIKDTGLIFDDVILFKDAGINYQATKVGLSAKGESQLSKKLLYEGEQKNKSDIEYWKGSNINKYYIETKTSHFVRTDYKSFIEKNERVILNKAFFAKVPKIILRQTASSIIATIDNRGVWFGRSVIGAFVNDDYKNKVDPYYALAIFNSQYIDFVYQQKVKEVGKVFPQVKLKYLKPLPFVVANKAQQKKIADLGKRMIELQKEFHRATENSEKWRKLKTEIERTDKKIDGEVYKLYGLSEEEIKVVEGK